MINTSKGHNSYARNDDHAGRSNSYTALRSRRITESPRGNFHRAGEVDEVPLNGLLANYILRALSPEEFASLVQDLEPAALSAGDDLYRSNRKIESIYFPETAVISHLHLLADGGMTEAAMIGRDGMVGLSAVFGARPPSYLTQVAVGGSALKIKTDILAREFGRGGALQKLLLAYASARLAQLSQRAVCNGRHKVEDRLCSWLLMIHDRVGEDQLPLTHERIACHLGVRRAGVTTAATTLKERGIISCSRGQIDIMDREALERAACECYGTFD